MVVRQVVILFCVAALSLEAGGQSAWRPQLSARFVGGATAHAEGQNFSRVGGYLAEVSATRDLRRRLTAEAGVVSIAGMVPMSLECPTIARAAGPRCAPSGSRAAGGFLALRQVVPFSAGILSGFAGTGVFRFRSNDKLRPVDAGGPGVLYGIDATSPAAWHIAVTIGFREYRGASI
jgi:hypothetical protein